MKRRTTVTVCAFHTVFFHCHMLFVQRLNNNRGEVNTASLKFSMSVPNDFPKLPQY